MVKRKCKYCGKEFKTYLSRIKKGGGKYCSKACFYKDREYPRGKDNPQYQKIRRICPTCGKEFWISPSAVREQNYCSHKCAIKRGEQHPNYKKVGLVCAFCGKIFYVRPSMQKKTKYCSKKCADNDKIGRHVPWNKWKRKGKIKTCSICGKKYYVPPGRVTRSKYCGWDCFMEAKRRVTGQEHPLYRKVDVTCDYCGKIYKEKPAKIEMYAHHFCSRKCLGCYTASHQNNPSSVEKKLAEYLIENKISFICQFKYELGIADFFIKPNLIIAVDGDYWHNLPNIKERDKRQTLYLEGQGYTVLHLWEHEINENPEKCIDRIKTNLAEQQPLVTEPAFENNRLLM